MLSTYITDNIEVLIVLLLMILYLSNTLKISENGYCWCGFPLPFFSFSHLSNFISKSHVLFSVDMMMKWYHTKHYFLLDFSLKGKYVCLEFQFNEYFERAVQTIKK